MRKITKLDPSLKTKVCPICGKTYSKPSNWSNKTWLQNKYCSRACRDKDPEFHRKRAIKISRTMKGIPKPKEHRLAISQGRRGIKFTEEHIKNLSSALKGRVPWNKNKKGLQVAWNKGKPSPWLRGEKNCNWRGGITSINKLLRDSPEYKQWREAVFKRDDYTCQICGRRGVKLHADHIKPFSLYPELRFEVSNGRTLCVDCHRKYGWNLFRENNPRCASSGNYDGYIAGQNL